jgi:hypothetical protein
VAVNERGDTVYFLTHLPEDITLERFDRATRAKTGTYRFAHDPNYGGRSANLVALKGDSLAFITDGLFDQKMLFIVDANLLFAPPPSDVAISQVVSAQPSPTVVGETNTLFEISVTNNGPGSARQVKLTAQFSLAEKPMEPS